MLSSLYRRRLLRLHKDRMVSFLIIGVQKSGTSALYQYLCKHPQICMGETKELHYFDNRRNFSDPGPDYGSYHRRFHPDRKTLICGEATPRYILLPEAMERIRNYNPDMRLIIILRNPVDRAFSHWQNNRQKGREDLSFEQAIDSEPERLGDRSPRTLASVGYLERGKYTEQIKRAFNLFTRDQCLILSAEDLNSNHMALLQRVALFLGLSPFPLVEAKQIHVGKYSDRMDQATRQKLLEHFSNEFDELEQLLGWDLSGWRQ